MNPAGTAPIPTYDWPAHHAWMSPERTALIDLYSGRRWSYERVNERVGRLAGYFLAGCGVGRGDRVAILAPNSADYLKVQFACIRLGVIFLPVTWRLVVPELECIVNDATPGILINDRQFER